MVTLPISVNSAQQRAGRAGRTSSGVCYRLWDEAQHAELQRGDLPEMHRADASTMLLDLACNGFSTDEQIASLPWVDRPRPQDLREARNLLQRMQLLREGPRGFELTERGRRVGSLPVHPRLGYMITQALDISDSFARSACDLAALLEERELLRGGRAAHGCDLAVRMDALENSEMKARRLRCVLSGFLLIQADCGWSQGVKGSQSLQEC